MNTLLIPLVEQLELLKQVIHQSPYISRADRLGIEKEIITLSNKIKEDKITFPQGEQSVQALNKRTAVGEIENLTTKIRQLNPSSPRLSSLRQLEKDLQEDEISPEQARKSLQQLMQA